MLSAFIIFSCVVTLAVVFHYEALYQLSVLMPKMHVVHRFRIALGVIGALIAHAVEIWLFAITYYLLIRARNWGYLDGNFDGSLLDCVYFSFTTYSTLGFGDIEPIGHIRFLTGIESLTGLVLITWTASFLYYQMQQYWGMKDAA